MAERKLFADVMREATASADYRRIKKVMNNMKNRFSKVRFTHVHNPDEQTLEMFRNEGFTVERESIKEYSSYKISW